MKPRRRLQQHHPDPRPLQRIQHPQPQPQRPGHQRPAGRGPDPWQRAPDAGHAPEDLCPPRRAEADSKHGEDPAVFTREVGELRKEEQPDDAEEEDDEEEDLPGGGVRRGPEEAPGAAVDRGEPVVLDEDGDEEALGW